MLKFALGVTGTVLLGVACVQSFGVVDYAISAWTLQVETAKSPLLDVGLIGKLAPPVFGLLAGACYTAALMLPNSSETRYEVESGADEFA